MTSTLNCLYWMGNQEAQDPCTVAQEVGLLCNPTYAVSKTNFKESNYVPNATTTNGCTCSWSMYNLLSACSYCVGQYEYTSWNTWTTNCGKYVSNNSYLPSGLESSHGIPFWAATNPGTWYNAVFNITEATNIAGQNKPDVSGGAIATTTTSTSSTSSSSSISTGAVAGGVIGGILILIIGGLLIFWRVRRRRRQRTPTDPTAIPSFNTSHPVVMPPTLNRTSAQPIPFGYPHASSAPLTSPVRSTASLVLVSPSSPVSAGFSSNGHNAGRLISDAGDVITPFLATSPQTNRSGTSLSTSKATEARAERVMAPPGSRGRLNPPSYSASVQAGLSEETGTPSRRLPSKKSKGPERSASGTTTFSGRSRTSTGRSVTVRSDSRKEQGRPRAATAGTVQSVESVISAGNLDSGGGGDSADGTPRGGNKGILNRPRPPAI